MPSISARTIVIDACIASGASSNEPPTLDGRPSRLFLFAVLAGELAAALTDELLVEWNNHQSRFARTWRLEMMQRGRMRMLGPAGQLGLYRRILEAIADEAINKIVKKDLHLIQAALDTDRIVASLERKVRTHFRNLCTEFDELRSIVWVNPNIEPDLVDWIERGAPHEASRFLTVIPG